MNKRRETTYYLDEFERDEIYTISVSEEDLFDDTDTMSVYEDLLYSSAINDEEEGFIRGYLAA